MNQKAIIASIDFFLFFVPHAVASGRKGTLWAGL